MLLPPQNLGRRSDPLDAFGEIAERSVRLLLGPLRGAIWAGEQIEAWLYEKIEEKLSGIPDERRIEPNLRIAVPAIEALRYIGPDEDISDLFGSLLASAMDAVTAEKVHPAFIEIVKQMTSIDAVVFRYMHQNRQVGYINVLSESKEDGSFEVSKSYFSRMWLEIGKPKASHYVVAINNLSRLGLIQSPAGEYLETEDYSSLQKQPSIRRVQREITRKNRSVRIEKRHMETTFLGKRFTYVCFKRRL